MSVTRRLVLQVQEDCYGRVLAHGYFNYAAVILERRAYTEQEIHKLLGTIKGRAGKVGLAILVQRPVFFPGADDSSRRGQLVQAFTVLEHPTLNAGDLGTGITAEEAAIELFNLLDHFNVTAANQVLSGFPGGAVVPDDSFTGLNAWEVRFQLFTSPGRDNACGLPLIDPDSGSGAELVTLSTATAGAEIYYTLDGSYPRAGNGTLYAAPFAPGAGVTVRAVAYKAGLLPSGVAQATFD